MLRHAFACTLAFTLLAASQVQAQTLSDLIQWNAEQDALFLDWAAGEYPEGSDTEVTDYSREYFALPGEYSYIDEAGNTVVVYSVAYYGPVGENGETMCYESFDTSIETFSPEGELLSRYFVADGWGYYDDLTPAGEVTDPYLDETPPMIIEPPVDGMNEEAVPGC